MNFFQMIDRILDHEGGLSLNPLDKGNWSGGVLKGTKYGISARSYPNVDIKNLTYLQAREIYKTDFYMKLMPVILTEATVFQLLDYAVNSGITRAIKALQKAVGTHPDGILGPITVMQASATRDEVIVALVLADRLEYMASLSVWHSFSKGWARRIAKNLRFAAKDMS